MIELFVSLWRLFLRESFEDHDVVVYTIPSAAVKSVHCIETESYNIASAHFQRLLKVDHSAVTAVDRIDYGPDSGVFKRYESTTKESDVIEIALNNVTRYNAMKQIFALQGKPTDETWVFHGTQSEVCNNICCFVGQ